MNHGFINVFDAFCGIFLTLLTFLLLFERFYVRERQRRSQWSSGSMVDCVRCERCQAQATRQDVVFITTATVTHNVGHSAFYPTWDDKTIIGFSAMVDVDGSSVPADSLDLRVDGLLRRSAFIERTH